MEKAGQVIKKCLKYLKNRNIETADRDVPILLSFVLGLSIAEIYSNFDILVTNYQLKRLEKLIARRGFYEPLAKIIGKKDFWNHSFHVDGTVLDPRPETELLVDTVLRNIGTSQHVLDLGTGSGCIAISLALELNEVMVAGCDISEEALLVARRNSKKNEAKVSFLLSDWFDQIYDKYDIIVSNPPYISQEDFANLPPTVKNFDPKIALLGGKDGLYCYRVIARSLVSHLKDDGLAFFEIGLGQKNDVLKIFSENSLFPVDVKQDLNGIDRVVCVKKAA